MLNLNELGQMNGSAGGAAGGEDEEFPAPHELGEELKFTGRYERLHIRLTSHSPVTSWFSHLNDMFDL